MIKYLVIAILLFTTPCFALTERYLDCSDGGAGDGTIGDPWATLQEAFDEVAADERINVLASATCTLGATVDVDGNSGTQDTPIIVQGYTAVPGDGGIGVIDGDDTAADCIDVDAHYYIWRDLEFKDATDDSMRFAAGDYHLLYNILVSGAGDVGIQVDAGSGRIMIINSEIKDTDDQGIRGLGSDAIVAYNYIHDTSGECIMSEGSSDKVFIGNILESCGKTCMIIEDDQNFLFNNTFWDCDDNAGNDNLLVGDDDNDEIQIIMNNIFQKANDENVEITTGSNVWLWANNNLYDNGGTAKSGTIHIDLGGEQAVDSEFEDASGGDFRLKGSSQLLGQGYEAPNF